MIEENYNIIRILKEKNLEFDVDELSGLIIDELKKEIISKPDEILLNLVFKDNPTQEDLNNFLKNWDIEKEGGHKALLLSYFMKIHPDLNYPEYVAPRLKGLLQFYRFQNLKLISHYKKICTELKNHGIDFLIFKGGAMKFLRPEFSRVMGDIDILVSKDDFKNASKIPEELGYDVSLDIHSIDIHPKGSDEGIMDIHKYIIMQSKKEKAILKDLFKRAVKKEVFGIETLVPCNEDLVFISLINMVRNLRNKTSYLGIPYTLFDCKYLIDSKPDFDWDIIIKNVKKTDTKMQFCFAVEFINGIVPNLLPKKVQLFEKEFEDYCILLIYQRFFLWEMKQKSHEMKIKNLFSSPEFFIEYMKLKPKYFILKLDIIKKNPFLAKMIMKLGKH